MLTLLQNYYLKHKHLSMSYFIMTLEEGPVNARWIVSRAFPLPTSGKLS